MSAKGILYKANSIYSCGKLCYNTPHSEIISRAINILKRIKKIKVSTLAIMPMMPVILPVLIIVVYFP